MGKTTLENSIQDEVGMLVKYLERQNLEEPMAMDWSINVAVLNVFWQLLTSTRYEADDEKIVKFTKMLDDDLAYLHGPMILLDIFPWIKDWAPGFIAKYLFREGKFIENRKLFTNMYEKIIKEHAATLDTNFPRDLVDHYLIELQNDKASEGVKFEHADVVAMMNDLFVAGIETTSNTLRWLVLYMAAFPMVQKKAHEALDRVVAKDKLPSLEDRQELAYIDAIILDTLRLSSLLPQGVHHCATADTQFEGYTIPKGTLMFSIFEKHHRDPALWEKPSELYPEHFLDSDGKLASKKEGFIPFGTGRRSCPGESLARMELYLFGSAILHRFEMSAPPGVTPDLTTDPNLYGLNHPEPFKVILKKRF